MKTVGGADKVAGILLRAVEANRVTCDEILILESGPYYAQLLFNHGVIFGEVVSNTFLIGSERLVTSQVDRLLGLGWSSPSTPCHSSCERSHPNFHRTWLEGEPSERVVRDLLVAMMVVSMQNEGEQLTFIRCSRRGHPSTGLPSSH